MSELFYFINKGNGLTICTRISACKNVFFQFKCVLVYIPLTDANTVIHFIAHAKRKCL